MGLLPEPDSFPNVDRLLPRMMDLFYLESTRRLTADPQLSRLYTLAYQSQRIGHDGIGELHLHLQRAPDFIALVNTLRVSPRFDGLAIHGRLLGDWFTQIQNSPNPKLPSRAASRAIIGAGFASLPTLFQWIEQCRHAALAIELLDCILLKLLGQGHATMRGIHLLLGLYQELDLKLEGRSMRGWLDALLEGKPGAEDKLACFGRTACEWLRWLYTDEDRDLLRRIARCYAAMQTRALTIPRGFARHLVDLECPDTEFYWDITPRFGFNAIAIFSDAATLAGGATGFQTGVYERALEACQKLLGQDPETRRFLRWHRDQFDLRSDFMRELYALLPATEPCGPACL